MRALSLVLILLAAAFTAACSNTRLSNIPVCQAGEMRECNRANGELGMQVCSSDGYWTTSCDARDAAADADDASATDDVSDADTRDAAPADAADVVGDSATP